MPNTRKVGVIMGHHYDGADVMPILDQFKAAGIQPEIISDKLGMIKGLEVDHTFLTADSVLFDAIYIAGGSGGSKAFIKEVVSFIDEAYAHFKPIGSTDEGKQWLENSDMAKSPGVVIGNEPEKFAKEFIDAITAHRHWDRQLV